MAVGRRQALALTGLALAGGVLVLAGRKRGATRRRKTVTPPKDDPAKPRPSGGWVDGDAPRRIREIAQPLADSIGWPDLPDLLVAIAWTESRGNPRAASDSGNKARGWFGMRPVSARLDDVGLPPSALKDERAAVGLITWYLHRLQPYAAPGQEIDLLALRRGMAYPVLVADVDETRAIGKWGPGERSRLTRSNFEAGIAAAGLPEHFMFNSAFLPGYHWPGINTALDIVGVGGIA